MVFGTRLALGLLVFAATPFGLASAADYEPPVIVDQAPEVPVEVGSGWYLRGDISYNINRNTYDVKVPSTEDEHIRFGASAGVGYHFTDYLRGEIDGSYIGYDRFYYSDPLITAAARNEQWSTMAKAYVDLGTIAGLTPYVGGGVGLMYSFAEIDDGYPGFAFANVSDTQTKFAYNLSAGLAY